MQSLCSFETNSPKGNMLKNQNNFIPHIYRDLAISITTTTLATATTSSIQFSHNNSKILQLFNQRSVVDFTLDEILRELVNESEIRNDSILSFSPANKQDISISHPKVFFNV